MAQIHSFLFRELCFLQNLKNRKIWNIMAALLHLGVAA